MLRTVGACLVVKRAAAWPHSSECRPSNYVQTELATRPIQFERKSALLNAAETYHSLRGHRMPRWSKPMFKADK